MPKEPTRKNTVNTLFKNKKITKSVNIATMGKEKKVVQSFMLEPTIKDLLLANFKSKGLSWGTGLRVIIMQYLKSEGVVR